MSDPRYTEIRARLGAATPGPWSWEVSADRHWAWVGTDAGDGFWDQPVAKCSNDDTAEFITHAPDDVAFLLSRVEELEEQVRNAPHHRACAIFYEPHYKCNCWKATP